MNKKKHMMAGFAIFTTMLMLISISPQKTEAAEDQGTTSTSTTNNIRDCYALLRLYLSYMKSSFGRKDSVQDAILERMQDILEDARAMNCSWATAQSIEDNMQSNLVQMNNQYINSITELASSPVQASSSSQSTCLLCASK